MSVVCGADGCRDGWVVITKDLESGEVAWRLCPTAAAIASLESAPQVIAIDIPIGLPDAGPRTCDPQARKLLGQPRGSSVFPAPIRPVLTAADYTEACQIWFGVEGKKMSKQGFAITPKIKEVDALLLREPALRDVFREVHPELCFWLMAGKQPVVAGKRTEEGMKLRRGLLEPAFGQWLHHALMDRRKLKCGADDILDAFAALWTAERIARGESQTIPSTPPRDSFGLRMEMVT